MTAFIITRDYVASEQDKKDYPNGKSNLHAKGLIGPRNASDADEARLRAGEGIKFRLLDDDGNVYYHGRRLEESDAFATYDAEHELAPLDCFGAPNAGAVTQQEKNAEGKWSSSEAKYSSTYGSSSVAARNYFLQMQTKATEAMSADNKRRWDMGCTMVPTNREKAKEVAAKIRQFRLEVMQELQNIDNKDALFALSTSFFEMTDVQPH